VVTTNTGDPAQACVDSINRHRATLRLPPLARWSAGEACASREAATDSSTNTPHGSFGSCGEYAQNVCPGWNDTQAAIVEPCVQDMWNEGPGPDDDAHGHYINMTSTAYSVVACGFVTLSDGSTWFIQNYQ
jgi:hypothetical protein